MPTQLHGRQILDASIALIKLIISGTPDGTKFLRDDGTWQNPPGGGGANTGTFQVDFGTNTTNLYQKSVTVNDANIQTTSRPIISLYNSGGREIDELEWVDFTTGVSAISNGVSFTVFVDDKNRVAEGIYTFSYQF